MKEINNKISSEEFLQMTKVLSDPVRSRILFEVLMHGERNTNEIGTKVKIGRSTLGYHLTKMVEVGLLSVRTKPIGRPTKFYSLNQVWALTQIHTLIEHADQAEQKNLIVNSLSFLITLLQMMTNIFQESLEIISSSHLKNIEIRDYDVTFLTDTQQVSYADLTTFEFSEDSIGDVKVLYKKFKKDLQALSAKDANKKKQYSVINGVFPIFL